MIWNVWLSLVIVYLKLTNVEGCSFPISTPRNIQPIFIQQTHMRYKCKRGYRFPGGEDVLIVRCQLNEMQWFPSKVDDCIPYCEECQNGGNCVLKEKKRGTSTMSFECECPDNYLGDKCQYAACSKAPYVPNSVAVNMKDGTRNRVNMYSDLSLIEYKCKDGYHIEGRNELICTSRSFRPQPPSCVANESRFYKICSNEYEDANLYSNSLLREGQYRKHAKYNPYKKYYTAGDVVNFKCQHDSYIEGTILNSISVKCVGDSIRASWNRQWPLCKKRTCPRLLINNGRVIPKSYENENVIGSTVTFNCSANYYLWDHDSSQVAKCQSNQQWNFQRPECITMNVFKNRCLLEREKIEARYSDGRTVLSCTQTAQYSRRANTDVNTITIVTASAAAVFGCLLVIVLIVAFQRRRLLHRIQRAHQLREERQGEEQLYGAGPYESAIQYLLPSYDEALRTKPTTDPPTFEEAIKQTEDQSESSSSNNNSLSEPHEIVNSETEFHSVTREEEDLPPPYPGSGRQSIEIAEEAPEIDFSEFDEPNVIT